MMACEKNDDGQQLTIVKGSGDISDEIDAFRMLLGDPLNNSTGVNGGRREINWDGVADDLVGQPLPSRLFNPTGPNAPVGMQRGLAYISGGAFQVSNVNFSNINEHAGSELVPYSGSKVFANISANDWEIEFEVPGQQVGAAVRGFGAVFTDVDLENSVSLEFFNQNESLGKYFVPTRTDDHPFSFFGLHIKKGGKITRVLVSHPAKISDGRIDVSNGGTDDLLALDDFFYDEPVAR